MKRTTIFLPDEVHERLRREAFAARISMARLIRARLEQGTARRRIRDGDPLAGVEGIVQDGRLTEGIDEALYSS
jgi:predicted transcriptional regulator